MAAKLDPEVLAHLEWIGFVQPTGLVVSAPALVRAGAILDRRDAEGQRLLRSCVTDRAVKHGADPVPCVTDFRTFARSVLGWSFSPKAYAGTTERPIPTELEVPIDGDLLRPDFAVRELEPQNGKSEWQLLVTVLDPEDEFDTVVRTHGGLELSAHGRMERLLRQNGVAAGLLFNGHAVRLMSAPSGESSGWADFKVRDMVLTPGRPIITALRLLLNEQRLLSLPRAQRLAALLDDSRKFQNEVSERLAEQVLHALYELLRGFQHANEHTRGDLLRFTLADHPDEVYRGLLTVLLRLVFLLYAEERDMLPEGEIFLRNYSVVGLYERLREDAALYPDTMEQRPGAWAQLLTLFRMIHDGAESGEIHLPKRHGALFDPDSYPFLEGRFGGARQIHERIEPPWVPDGTIYRALEKLLVLDGERISYRALDVEQIGSVYETMMGFRLERTTGPSIAVKAEKKHGAPTAIDLEELLAVTAEKRDRWIAERTDRKLADSVKKAVKAATSVEDLHAALSPVVDRWATPDLIPAGSMVLQPSEERRRSGSHYTPRSLTHPIVKTTLEPILARLRGEDGRPPKPEQILDLKVCDLAMGSGAFLVEACRQLGEALVEAWRAHHALPEIPPDEREDVFAMRVVAQRCLYGVDRNPMAVDLAKVSLWLITLAKDHPLTFIDHALRHGDSLVGLTRRHIEAFHWDESQPILKGLGIREPIDRAFELRRQIRDADDSISDGERRELWERANAEVAKVRLFGDLVIAAFFEGENAKQREAKRKEYASAAASGETQNNQVHLEKRRSAAEKQLVPFHWQSEFPEVFERESSGFDAIVGNPPFMGGIKISGSLSQAYLAFLYAEFASSGGQADLVAFFFRRAFSLIRSGGCFGLVGTNTVGQGDTRESGLTQILRQNGIIYSATRRCTWPGAAAVIVSIVHVMRDWSTNDVTLDGKRVGRVSAFLFPGSLDSSPAKLSEHDRKRSFLGSMVAGVGFTFEDGNDAATPTSAVSELIEQNPRNAERIFGFLGGEEINVSPVHRPHRWIIDFGGLTEADASQWPELLEIVRHKVKPYRDTVNREAHRRKWWQYGDRRVELYETIRPMTRVLVASQVSQHLSFAFVRSNLVFSHAVDVFAFESYAAFCALQSRVHETWARFFGSTLEDRLRYTPSDCFETFPFPENWENHASLEEAGKVYYEHRAALMIANDEGLTKAYNRFHDCRERDPGILKLRDLHAAMDRAVLDAYGWDDIRTDCDYFLDYEVDEEEWGSKKKPYRYRWPDEVRDEVLARLLDLNAQRAAEEARKGVAKQKSPRKRTAAAVPLFEVPAQRTPITPWVNVPDGAWARPQTTGAGDEAILLSLILLERHFAPAREIRLAALLASEPALLTPLLDGAEASEWTRLVGAEAQHRRSNDAVAEAWGEAVRFLDAKGDLVDDGSGTWSAGPSLSRPVTAPWHERALWVVEKLGRRNIDAVVNTLPTPERRVIDGEAA